MTIKYTLDESQLSELSMLVCFADGAAERLRDDGYPALAHGIDRAHDVLREVLIASGTWSESIPIIKGSPLSAYRQPFTS